ncbi:hypothetical protein HF1_13210 [Mycoplasma haemofelis str. Langford 1]|uniref:Lipoprotein n=1 Tax=Mycoplasma haemofelis (strain Langford 1) TaxID=941640 RepID=E8ZJK8_MYCHL|nr:hypothetical protein [Mycoplasma haemofelis]CBY93329.1 hypothetical protein HF1_13210 [Mycoplasma haemofelis str. Langford 1]
MNSLLAKSIALACGASAAVGGGILAWSKGLFSNSKSIKNKLISEKYQILKSDSTHWTKIWEQYQKGENKDWKFKGQINSVERLKTACNQVIEESRENQSLYKNASKWCVVPRKAEEFVSGLLDVTEGKDGDAWGRVLTRYENTKTPKSRSPTKYALEGVLLSEPNENNKADNIKKLQGGCSSRRSKLTYELDFDSSIKEMEEWCVDRGN